MAGLGIPGGNGRCLDDLETGRHRRINSGNVRDHDGVGILLLIGAIFRIVTAFWARRWRGVFLHLLAGILYLIAGGFMVENPLEAAVGLTLLIAACLLVGGIFRIVLSVVERFDGWGWMLLNGIISVLLGVCIWRQWPLSGFWVIGLFMGIEMLFSGLSWVMLGLTLRSTAKSFRLDRSGCNVEWARAGKYFPAHHCADMAQS